MLRKAGWLALLVGVLAFAAAGCGSSSGEKESEGAAGDQIQAACKGSQLSSAPKLPASFPQIEAEKLVYTQQRTDGPTEVIEGYFNGDVKDAHDEFKKELQGAGYKILFDELEEHDSEVSWSGEGRTGQVALREECGDSGKTYVHITNRPA